MRTCSYCGKEYPDDIATCLIDGMDLPQQNLSPVPPLLPTASQVLTTKFPNARQLRLIELILVCAIAMGGSLFSSIATLIYGRTSHSGGMSQWSYGIVQQVTSLALLWYVLQRRSKTFSDLGLIWRWTDIGWSILLCIAGYIAYCIAYTGAYYANVILFQRSTDPSRVADFLFGNGISPITIVFLCLNPFVEELIARAYLMKEVKKLTNNVGLAVVASTIFQASYHLYQGVPLALAVGANFFVWSLYYAKTNRITPIILAHLYFDLGSTLIYLARH